MQTQQQAPDLLGTYNYVIQTKMSYDAAVGALQSYTDGELKTASQVYRDCERVCYPARHFMNQYIKDWDWQQYDAAQVELNKCTQQHKKLQHGFSPRWKH